jgi:hypothetical protein
MISPAPPRFFAVGIDGSSAKTRLAGSVSLPPKTAYLARGLGYRKLPMNNIELDCLIEQSKRTLHELKQSFNDRREPIQSPELNVLDIERDTVRMHQRLTHIERHLDLLES